MVTEYENKYKIGDLVKWYEYYADGDIVKDAGRGLVVQILNRSSEPWEGERVLYLVYRNRKGTQEYYTGRDLELIAAAG